MTREEPVKMELNSSGNRRGMSPNSRKNLTLAWKANNHAKKELSLTHCAREKLSELCPYAPGKTWLQYLVERWLGQSIENATYFRELIERLEGKVLQPVGGENGEPIKYEISVKDSETKEFTDRLIKGGQVVSYIGLS